MNHVRHMGRKGIPVLIIACILGAFAAMDYYRPFIATQWSNIKWSLGGHGWETAGQPEVVLNTRLLRNTSALLIIKDGNITYEKYFNKSDANQRYWLASLSKSLAGSLSLLIALNDELIHLDDPAWRYIKEWEPDPQKKKITIRHLATHSSGISYVSAQPDITDEWERAFWERTPDLFPVILSEAPMACIPGDCYIYSGPGYAALGYAVTSSLGKAEQSDISGLLKNRVMKPLGIPDSDWVIGFGESHRVDGMKLYAIWSGASFTARAAARIGQLMLNMGTWDNSEIANPDHVKDVISYGNTPPRKALTRKPLPTPGWWSNADCIWPSLPEDAYVGAGAGHEILLIVPSLDMVVVRFGKKYGQNMWGGDFWDALESNLFKPLMDSLFTGKHAC